MKNKLNKKNILITGGSGYLGEAMGERLASAGASLINIGRTEPNFCKSNKSAKFIKADFYSDDSLDESLNEAIQLCGNVDVLINNSFDFSQKTGFNTNLGRIENINKETFINGITSGIYWPTRCSQIIGQHMKINKTGNIINIASLYSFLVPNSKMYENTNIFNPVIYSLSKHATSALTKYLASFWGPYGIRVNSLSPGTFPNTKGSLDKESPNSVEDNRFLDMLNQKCILGRVGVPKDLGAAIEYLCSDKSKKLTGENIVIDGGWSLR